MRRTPLASNALGPVVSFVRASLNNTHGGIIIVMFRTNSRCAV